MSTINIGCQDASHEGRSVKVISFKRLDGGWVHGYHGDPYVSLIDDIPAEQGSEEYTMAMLEGRNRRRYSLECRLCGLSVEARSETLHPLLDRVADHGVSYVELAHVARILS